MPDPFTARSSDRCQTKIAWGVSSIAGAEKPGGRFGRLRQRHAFDRNPLGKRCEQARWHGPIEHDEDPRLAGGADERAMGLPQPQPGNPIGIFDTAEHWLASPVQYIGAW